MNVLVPVEVRRGHERPGDWHGIEPPSCSYRQFMSVGN